MGRNEESPLQGKRILIADDEPDVLEILEDLLSMCQVTKATRFEQAKKQLETQKFDFAILDIMGINGYKLLELAVEKDVTVVMLTAHAMSLEDTMKSFNKGAASYVPKDEMGKIEQFLLDILEARQKGKSLWWKWMERLDAYYAVKFGKDWQEGNKEFWKRLTFHI